MVGPVGTAVFVSISGFLFSEIILTNKAFPFSNQLITPPTLAFKFASEIFVTLADLISKTHNSTPFAVVLVRAILL